ncbi:recombination directionality factor [Arthrobacter phage Tuck]|uniref:Recombination directionality factor n=1 Tax=Arthrobacter phage Tuck TaxID=2998996 RepID=A0A9E8S3H9_9CAUD|nr:recombination directionality factor [Arthrobacter phage Tuck]
MALKIFGDNPETASAPRKRFADDVVGRFRSGHQINNRPAALTEWRVTTGDPEVADAVHEILGGDAPQDWDAKGEDNIEVFTASKEVEIILEGEKALRQKMVLWSRAGKLVQSGDGQTIDYPEDKVGPDPDAHLSFQERKAKARDGIGAEPQIEVYFRLADDPDLGIFKFQTGSWSMASDLAYNDVEGELADYVADSDSGKVLASLKLEEVSFVAKNGPRAGQTVTYTKPVLKIKGAA